MPLSPNEHFRIHPSLRASLQALTNVALEEDCLVAGLYAWVAEGLVSTMMQQPKDDPTVLLRMLAQRQPAMAQGIGELIDALRHATSIPELVDRWRRTLGGMPPGSLEQLRLSGLAFSATVGTLMALTEGKVGH